MTKSHSTKRTAPNARRQSRFNETFREVAICDTTRHDTALHMYQRCIGVTNEQLNVVSSFITSTVCGSGNDLHTGSSKGLSNKLHTFNMALVVKTLTLCKGLLRPLTYHCMLNTKGADKSLARPNSRCRRTESICRWKEGTVPAPNCKSFLVTEDERKYVR